MESLAPEHRHYGTIEKRFKKSIAEGSDFLFHSDQFYEELSSLEANYGVPYDVSQTILPISIYYYYCVLIRFHSRSCHSCATCIYIMSKKQHRASSRRFEAL